MKNLGGLVKKVSMNISYESGAHCGFDLLMGLEQGNVERRVLAWERYLYEVENKQSHTDEIRDGIFVPAIEL